MARLTVDVITYIVTRLACFERPAEIQAAVLETFGVDVGLPQILYYDPKSRGTDMAQKWRKLHADTRAAFTRDVSQIPIANRAVRLRELQKLYEKDEGRGATALAAGHLEQAAKEVGDAFTNRRMLLPGDADALTDELSKILGVDRDDLLGAVGGAP